MPSVSSDKVRLWKGLFLVCSLISMRFPVDCGTYDATAM